jgi:hypothetical protein
MLGEFSPGILFGSNYFEGAIYQGIFNGKQRDKYT